MLVPRKLDVWSPIPEMFSRCAITNFRISWAILKHCSFCAADWASKVGRSRPKPKLGIIDSGTYGPSALRGTASQLMLIREISCRVLADVVSYTTDPSIRNITIEETSSGTRMRDCYWTILNELVPWLLSCVSYIFCNIIYLMHTNCNSSSNCCRNFTG